MSREEIILEQIAMMHVLDSFKSYVYALMDDEIHIGYVHKHEFLKDALDNFNKMINAELDDSIKREDLK